MPLDKIKRNEFVVERSLIFGILVLNFVLIVGFATTAQSQNHELARKKLKAGRDLVISVVVDKQDRGLLNKMLVLDVKVESATTQLKDLAKFELLSFDARMPAHNHGMLVKASFQRVGLDAFAVSGVKFHMRGDWVLYLQILYDDQKMNLEIPVQVLR